jgi:EF-P beta-lysylation protein EpmB
MAIVASRRQSVGGGGTIPSWREAMKRAVRDAARLCRLLELPAEFSRAAARAAADFPVFAPLEFVARMQQGDPHDPLLRQVLPAAEETETVPGFLADPVGDGAATVLPGLLQKYSGRMLMVTTGACAVHCRYCFRRHFPYDESLSANHAWDSAIERVAADERIDEVLLSGGDPLTLGDDRLSELAQRLAAIPHVRRLRVHTRLPIVIPQRVNGDLLSWLRGTRLTPVMVVHVNHAQEIDQAVADSLQHLVDAGIPVLNQAVLLRGINDDTRVLTELCRRLIDLRVMPYYLHELDPVAGAHHFAVPRARGEQLVAELRAVLPGYAVPRFVREVPGEQAKRIVA